MSEVRNEEYFKRYTGLYNLILKSYVDKYLLEAIKIYNYNMKQGKATLTKNGFYILDHICELIKCDLALIIWKIYIDNNPKANTIQHLNTFVHKEGKGKRVSMSLAPQYGLICDNIKQVRSTFLAHDDLQQKGNPIKMEDLFDILDELREKFNVLCDEMIDDRVRPITKGDVGAISLKSFISFLSMIQNDAVKIQD